jgi:hypothetical protein
VLSKYSEHSLNLATGKMATGANPPWCDAARWPPANAPGGSLTPNVAARCYAGAAAGRQKYDLLVKLHSLALEFMDFSERGLLEICCLITFWHLKHDLTGPGGRDFERFPPLD